MTTPMETATINIKHERVENKIAGIMMFNNIFSSGGRASAKVVEWIYQFVPIELVIQMVQTESNEKSVAIQSAALNFLVYSCESSSIARSLLAFVAKLCDVFVKTKRTEFKSQLGTFLKLLALVSGSKGKKKIIDALLEATHNEKCTDSLPVLNLFVEIATTPSSSVNQEGPISKEKAANMDSNMRTLTSAHCGVLRSSVIQGFHGAAPPTTRDATFLCVQQLLTWIPDSADSTGDLVLYHIFPVWTWSVEDPASATFPMFLCSILRSELQLLCDELLFLATNSAETVAERFNLTISAKATVPASMGATKSARDSTVPVTEAGDAANGDGGDANGTFSGEKADINTSDAESAPAVDPAVALQRKIAADIRYFQSRVARTHAMYLTCLQLVDCVLNLLIGEKETVTDSRWSTLPGKSLLSIKKVLYSMLNDLFEFLIDCAERLKEIECETNGELNGAYTSTSSAEKGSFAAASSLRSVACCALDTMSRFLEQDNELMEVFVKCVPKLLTISHVHKGGEVSAGAAADSVLQALVGYVSDSNGMEDSKQRWLDLLAYDPASTTTTVTASTASDTTGDNTSDNTTTTNNNTTSAFNAFHCELYLHLVEPIRTLIFLGNSNDLFPTTYDALVDCVPLLLPQLVGLLTFIFSNISTSMGKDSTSIGSSGDVFTSTGGTYPKRSLVSAGLSLLWLLQDLLTIQQGKHLAETKLLLRGEGLSVLVSRLGVEASVLVEFAQTQRTIAAQLREHQTAWLTGATAREVEETGVFVVASLQIAQTLEGLLSALVGMGEEPCCSVL